MKKTKIQKRVFIGSALTHLPLKVFDEYKSLIIDIANLVETTFECKATHALENSEPVLLNYKKKQRPTECYKMDRKHVEQCDLFIAEASFPSTGLGQELQIAETNKKPIILIYRNYINNLAEEKNYKNKSGDNHSVEIGNRIVSVMAQGNPAIIKEIYYDSSKECIKQLKAFFTKNNTCW